MNKPLYNFMGALVLLIAVGVLYGIWYNMVGAETTQISQIEQQVAQKNQVSEQVTQAKAELTALTSDESTVNQYFVSTTNVVPFLEQLQSTGSYLGSTVTVASVSATPSTTAKPYGQLTLSLSITGSFDSVMRTIGAIEYGPYDTSITSLTLDGSSGNAASSSDVWNANVVFNIGTQVGKSLVATPDTNVATTTPTVVTPVASTSVASPNTSTTSDTSEPSVHATAPKLST